MDHAAVSKRRGRFIAYAPLFLWIAIILILGSGPGSSAQTSRFIRPLIEFFFPDASPDTFVIVHSFIRKAAHFIEYAVLALLSTRACLASSGGFRKHWWLCALAVVAAVAITDETSQSFYNSRTSSGWDVSLDMAGGAFALVCVIAVRRRWIVRRAVR
jgi:VanZ family protein